MEEEEEGEEGVTGRETAKRQRKLGRNAGKLCLKGGKD